jgi:hypothetical protein
VPLNKIHCLKAHHNKLNLIGGKMKIWLIVGVIALVAVLAFGGLFLTKNNFAKADASTTGNTLSSGCGCGENCACGCKGQCTEESDCGCLKEGGNGCAAASGGSCGCKK